jgi:hypothetical protein
MAVGIDIGIDIGIGIDNANLIVQIGKRDVR